MVLVLRFPDRVYEVVHSGRDFARLLDVWGTYVAGRKWRKGSVTLRVLELGIRYEFGRLFDPPRRETQAELARAFGLKQTTIQSRLRKYRRITTERSIK